MDKSSLLVCPDCLQNGTRKILGAVTANGQLIVKRMTNGHGHDVTVVSQEYMIVCNCGYGTTVNNTQIRSYSYTRPLDN